MKVENKTIIITDPCYIIKNTPKNPNPFPWDPQYINSKNFDDLVKEYHAWEREHDDWAKCDYGDNMEALNITNYLSSNTTYGDWSCTTYNSDTEKVLGKFCADAGLVGVFILDEVLKYNPDFNYHIAKPWTTTVIENFTGTVEIKVVTISRVHEEDSVMKDSNGIPYYKKGDVWEDDEVRVIGSGSINFYTTQTEL